MKNYILEVGEGVRSVGNKEDVRDKFNRVDLKVKNQQDEIIIIEVQYDRELDYLQRILFGTSRVITEHLCESKPYADIVKVISVNILYFDLGQGEDYVYHGSTGAIKSAVSYATLPMLSRYLPDFIGTVDPQPSIIRAFLVSGKDGMPYAVTHRIIEKTALLIASPALQPSSTRPMPSCIKAV